MKPKPAFLGPEFASQFADPSVVEAYRHRPAYPAEAAEMLLDLIRDEPARILEVGCGPGSLTRLLAPHVASIDAVDPSAGMLAEARRLAGSACGNVSWIHAPIETATLAPPYALVVAGMSLHWTDWGVTFPRLARALTSQGRLAMVGQRFAEMPWTPDLTQLCQRYSTNREFEPFDLVAELTERGLFDREERLVSEPQALASTAADFIESFHSSNGFSRDRMTEAAARAFDEAVGDLVRPYLEDGLLRSRWETVVNVGQPLDPDSGRLSGT